MVIVLVLRWDSGGVTTLSFRKWIMVGILHIVYGLACYSSGDFESICKSLFYKRCPYLVFVSQVVTQLSWLCKSSVYALPMEFFMWQARNTILVLEEEQDSLSILLRMMVQIHYFEMWFCCFGVSQIRVILYLLNPALILFITLVTAPPMIWGWLVISDELSMDDLTQ